MWKAITGTTVVLAMASLAWAPVAAAQQQDQERQQRPSGQQQRTRQQPQMGPEQRGDRANEILEDLVLVRLAEEAWVGGDFKVTAKDGAVTITGTVPREATKARMGRIARQTTGVTEVANNLKVVPTAGQGQAVGDAELASRVARQIASAIPGAKSGQDWWLDGWRVEGADNLWSFTVEAEEGRVYLDGEVPRLAIMRQAVDAARQTAGVESVRSDFELDRYVGYPYVGYHPYHYWPYHPYAYDPASFFYDVEVLPARRAGDARTMTGEVTAVDRQQGRVTLRTDRGTFQLPLPPSALQNVQEGERMTVRVDAGGSPAASPGDRTQGGRTRQ